MASRPVTGIVIVGGGTSGWMTAAALSRTDEAKPMERIRGIHHVIASDVAAMPTQAQFLRASGALADD